MESVRRSSFLFDRIFFDEPVSTSSENALARTMPTVKPPINGERFAIARLIRDGTL